MGAAFIRRNGVDFIDDDGPDRLRVVGGSSLPSVKYRVTPAS